MANTVVVPEDLVYLFASEKYGHRPDFQENYPKYRELAKIHLFGSLYGMGAAKVMAIVAAAEPTIKVTYTDIRDIPNPERDNLVTPAPLPAPKGK